RREVRAQHPPDARRVAPTTHRRGIERPARGPPGPGKRPHRPRRERTCPTRPAPNQAPPAGTRATRRRRQETRFTMARVKRGPHRKNRRKKVLDQASGYFGKKSSAYRIAKQQVDKGGVYAYVGRKQKKRDMRA